MSGLLRNYPLASAEPTTFANIVSVKDNPASPSGTDGFPNPVGGVITLDTDTCYKLIEAIDIGTNRLVMPDHSCLDGEFGASLTSAVTGQAMITTLANAHLTGINFFPSSPTTSFINAVPGSLVFGQNIFIDNCTIQGFTTLGNIGNYSLINFHQITFVGNTNPLTVKNGIGVMYCDELLVVLTNGQQFLNMDVGLLASDGFEIHSSLVKNSVGSVFCNVQNVLSFPSEGFRIINSSFDDGSIAFTGITNSDVAYFARITIGLKNTTPTSLYSFAGNVTSTTVTTNGTWYKIAGTTTNPYTLNKFTNTTTNRATYTGKNPRALSVTANVGGTGGSNSTYEFTIGKDGTPLAEYATPVTTGAAGAAGSTTIVGIVDVVTNNYIEVFVRRTNGTGNFTANSGVVRIQEI